MPFLRVSETLFKNEIFAALPEAYPNVQFLRRTVEGEGEGRVCAIINGQIVIDPKLIEPEEIANLLQLPWYSAPDPVEAFLHWLETLEAVSDDEFIPVSPEAMGNAVLSFQIGPLPPHPQVVFPPPPYAHLPLNGNTQLGDVFYRCEAMPVSRALDVQNDIIRAGTYAFPESEGPFIPTGLSVVGRYASPCFFPAIFRYTLTPQPTFIKCGACVPQFGQAGGGVEVQFVGNTLNKVSIPSPVRLPVL